MVGLVAQCIKKNRAEEERRERSEESSEEENDDENSIVSVRPQEKTRTIEQLFQHLDAARSERKAKRGRSRNFEIFAPADVVKAEEMLGVKMMNRGRGKSDEEERFKECEGKGEDKGEVEEDQEDEEVDMVVNGDIIEEAENTTQISGDASKRHSYDDLEPEVSRRARKDLDNFDDSFVDPDLILEDAEKTEDISGRNVSKGRRKAQLFHLYDVDVGNDDDDDDQRVFLGGEGSEIMNGNDETENISTLMSFASVERGGLLDPIHNPMEDSQDNISFVLDTTPKRYPEEMKYQEKIMEQSERVDFIAQREREEIVEGQKGHEQRQIGLFKTSRVTNTPFLTSARPTATEYITPRPSTSAYTLIGNIIEIPDDSDTEDNKPSGQSSPDIRSILKIIESAERWTDEVLYTVLCSLDHSSSIRILDPLSISLSSSNRQQGIRKYMEYETIIAPIHHKGVAPHWTLVIMRPREHRFEFWDSLEE
ncbi:hypothetical protein MFRU_078g00030 [Monilinia fructicola]|nr:hypothetical protein MFRU_078g00030 [Monilinia fructicola]